VLVLSFNFVFSNGKTPESLTDSLLHQLPIACGCIDSEGNLLAANDRWSTYFGMENLVEFKDILPSYQPCGLLTKVFLQQQIQKALNVANGTDKPNKGLCQFELFCNNSKGELACLEITMQSYHPNYVIAYAYDVTHYKVALSDAMEKERAATDRQHQLYDANPIPASLWNSNHQIIDCNEAMVKFLGLSNKEETLRRFFEFSPSLQPCGTSTKEKALIIQTEAIKNGSAKTEWLHFYPDTGELIPGEVTIVRIDTKNSYVLAAYLNDMREIVAAAKKEQEVIWHQQQIYNANPIPASLWDSNANPIDCNNAVVEMLGLSCKEEYFNNFFAYVPEKQACGTPSIAIFSHAVKETLEKGFHKMSWVHKTAEGEPVPGEVTVVRIDLENEYIFAVYMQDLRPLREAEGQAILQTQKALEYREKLLSTVNQAAEILLTTNEENTSDALMAGMELVGRCLDVDRVQIWRNEEIDGELHFVMRYQWLSEIGNQKMEVPIGLSASYSNKPEWFEMFSQGKSMNTIVSELPPEDASFLGYYEMVSIVNLPLFLNQEFIGFFSIDDCRRERIFTDDEMDMIASTGLMFTKVFNQLQQKAEIEATLERELEANQMVSLLLEASPLFIEIYDDQLNLIDCNNQYMTLFGMSSKSEFIEKYESLSPEYQPCGTCSKEKLVALLERALMEGSSRSEWMHFTSDGEELPVEVVFVRLIRQNKRIIVGYNHDIRQIKKAMSEIQRIVIAEESNEAKSRFLARMSHEIRTPITAVLGISEIQLQNTDLSPQLEESFAKIHSSANILLGIVNDILDLSKIEAGKMNLMSEKYDLASMISDVAHLHLAYSGDKNIKFNLHVDENLPKYPMGDVLRIEQIINNLLSNAFKYTETGSVDMSLLCQRHKTNDDYMSLVISISDTGLGMTKEQMDILLKNEYTRFHEHGKHFISGTGLGIPIVSSLLDLMDASMVLRSEVNVGTNVTVHIPQKIASTEVIGMELAARLQQFEEFSHIRTNRLAFAPEPMPYGSVLVVDDVEANLYVAKGLLAFYDLNIETCESGFEAIRRINQGNVYDIVFMDQMMPDINGTESMQILRDMGYKQPIVALTANALIGQAEEFISNGFDGFISKPIQTKQLNTILTKYIKDKQSPETIKAAIEIANSNLKVGKNDSKSNIKAIDDKIEGIENFQNDAGLLEKLRKDFARDKKNIFTEISQALSKGDIKTAHLLAHTLKGLAGLIHETQLQQAAEQVEHSLAMESTPSSEQLSILKLELENVLKDINKTEAVAFPANNIATNIATLDKDKAIVLLDKLELLLKSRNAECLELLDELREIPEAAILAKLIEDFDFTMAIKILQTLRIVLEL